MDVVPTKEKAARKTKGHGNQRKKNRPIEEDNRQHLEFEAGSSRSSGSAAPRNDRTRRPPKELPSPNGTAKGVETGNQTFEEGEDFIPFTLSEPPSSAEEDNRDNDRDGGRARARELDGSRGRDWERGVDEERRLRDRGWNEDRRRGRDRSDSPRPLDKGKGRAERTEKGYQNGKHEMVFDFNDGFANKKQRVDASSRKAPWIERVDWEKCNNVAEMLHREVEAFVQYISPTPVEDEVRGLVVELVSRAITKAFPDATVSPFGSYATKLYLPRGDIDLMCQSRSMAYSNNETVLHALASTLKRANITSKVSIIAHAKVPIVKFVTTHGRFNVDISVNQPNGKIAAEVVNGFIKDMHDGGIALRALIMITKAFLSQRSMNEVFTGGLGSYSIVCLVVSFLQMHPKIRGGEIDPGRNLGVLVIEFFELYGCYFNYEEVGISILDGGTYFRKEDRGWLDWRKAHLLSVEDPIDPSNDISKGSYGVSRVRTTFAGAYGILTAAAYLRAGIINARRDGRSWRLRDRYNPEDMSILSSVLGVTQETINHRRLVQEVYDNRTLHRLVGVSPQNGLSKVDMSSKFVPATQSTRSARDTLATESVDSAWGEADMDPETDDDVQQKQKEEYDDGGRYAIGPPSRKRRKTGGRSDRHVATVFITDEEDEAFAQESEDSLDEEEREYDWRLDESSASRPNVGQDRRRSYWLSKGGTSHDSS